MTEPSLIVATFKNEVRSIDARRELGGTPTIQLWPDRRVDVEDATAYRDAITAALEWLGVDADPDDLCRMQAIYRGVTISCDLFAGHLDLDALHEADTPFGRMRWHLAAPRVVGGTRADTLHRLELRRAGR